LTETNLGSIVEKVPRGLRNSEPGNRRRGERQDTGSGSKAGFLVVNRIERFDPEGSQGPEGKWRFGEAGNAGSE
jgi:hypothetical protein